VELEPISFNLCPFVQRSVITLLYRQVPYRMTYIDLDAPPDWFLSISPFGKVPVLKVGGRHILFESAVINEFIDEVSPGSRTSIWTSFAASEASSPACSADRLTGLGAAWDVCSAGDIGRLGRELQGAGPLVCQVERFCGGICPMAPDHADFVAAQGLRDPLG